MDRDEHEDEHEDGGVEGEDGDALVQDGIQNEGDENNDDDDDDREVMLCAKCARITYFNSRCSNVRCGHYNGCAQCNGCMRCDMNFFIL